MESKAQAAVPASLSVTFEQFLALAQEKEWKILATDPAQYTIRFKVPGNRIEFNGFFTQLRSGQTQVRLNGIHNGTIDYGEEMTTSFIEPLLTRISDKQRSEAEAAVAGASREEILRTNQGVTPEADKALNDLSGGLSAYIRRDAARSLAALPEPNERIAAALIMARETDSHDNVKSAAAEVLQTPALAAVLERDPAWAARVLALTRIAQSGQIKQEQEKRANNRSATAIIGTGYTMVFVSIIGLLLPLVGYQLIFRGIPTGQPLVAGGIGVLGVLALVFGYRSQK